MRIYYWVCSRLDSANNAKNIHTDTHTHIIALNILIILRLLEERICREGSIRVYRLYGARGESFLVILHESWYGLHSSLGSYYIV